MKIIQRAIADIKPYGSNPRQNDDAVASVAESIRQFGFRQPIVIDGEGVIVCGHTRWKAARKLGMDDVPVHVAEGLTPDQIRAYRLADNKTGELAGWDMGLLPDEIEELLGTDIDMTALGFTQAEIDEMLAEETEGMTDPDAVPESPDDPITKPGDLWLLGEHRVLCGDSTKAEDVERVMDGAKAGLCFTSPPYNAGNICTGAYAGGSAKRSDFKRMYDHDLDAMPSKDYIHFMLSVLRQVACVLDDNGVCGWNVCYNAHARREFGEIVFSRDNPLPVQETIVWDKGSGMNVSGSHIYSRSAEFVFLLARTHEYRSNQNGGVYWNIWRISNRDGDNMQNNHGASFPVALPSQSMIQHSVCGETVYDPFLGSGTTLIAAEQLGRKCYGIEISPAYCDVIVKRWEAFTGKQATRE